MQQFRDSNPFGPGSDGGSRLTVLNSGSFRQPPPRSQEPERQSFSQQPQNNFPSRQQQNFAPEPQRFDPEPQRFAPEPQRFAPEPQRFAPEPQSFAPEPQNFAPQQQASPIRSFAAVPAVPESFAERPEEPAEPATFGSRFQSRRPPSTRQRPSVTSSVSEEISSLPRQRPVPRRPPPSNFNEDPRPSSFNLDNFEPQRQGFGSTGGRQRLEVTEIRVKPQNAQEFLEEPIDIDAFRQVANRFRQRGSQQQ